jgi:2,3-diketo-5-methylthio-1-phosphopentane phosphatase
VSSLHIFCDFDGTIATDDIGDALFDRFGKREPWHTRLMAGELNIRDYWLQMAANLHDDLTIDDIDAFLREAPIDPGFAELHALAREHSLPLTIVSDGFDLYIERFLALNGFSGIDIRCNQAELRDARLEMRFPLAVEGCDCMCATCKRNVLLTTADPDARIVFIGDGVSDFCPAEHADIIFAKKRLAAYCNEHRLPHYPYATLGDVARQLRTLLARKRIRIRHQAAVKRKKAFEYE